MSDVLLIAISGSIFTILGVLAGLFFRRGKESADAEFSMAQTNQTLQAVYQGMVDDLIGDRSGIDALREKERKEQKELVDDLNIRIKGLEKKLGEAYVTITASAEKLDASFKLTTELREEIRVLTERLISGTAENKDR
jgi:hypothetical protein